MNTPPISKYCLQQVLIVATTLSLTPLTIHAQTKDGNEVVDVRFSRGETRMLDDPEYAKLRQGLHYSPKTSLLAKGASARTTLMDGRGTPLATVTIQWLRTDRKILGTKTTTSGETVNKYGPPIAYFRLTVQNLSNCVLSPRASLAVPGSAIDADAVNSIVWGGWMTLHDPSPGQTQTFEQSSQLDQEYSSLVLKPREPDTSLSQCRTGGQNKIVKVVQYKGGVYNGPFPSYWTTQPTMARQVIAVDQGRLMVAGEGGAAEFPVSYNVSIVDIFADPPKRDDKNFIFVAIACKEQFSNCIERQSPRGPINIHWERMYFETEPQAITFSAFINDSK